MLSAPVLASVQIPGRWEEVLRIPNRVALTMTFGDAEHGVLLLDSSFYTAGSVTTSDGGLNWRLAGQGLARYWSPQSFHAVTMPTASDIYLLEGTSFVSRDGGNTWIGYQLAILGAPVSSRIFPNGIGRAISISGGGYGGVTIWTCSDSAKYFYDVQSYDGLSIDSFRDAIFLDTMEFWVSYWPGQVLHTTDGGYNWERISVMPSMDTLHSFQWISPTADRRRFYVSIGRNQVPVDHQDQQDTFVAIPPLSADFAETTDDGNTWRIDSSIGDSRIYRLVSPAANKLWAFVGREPPFYDRLGFLRYTQNGTAYPLSFADSLFYSSDDGHTWYKDSTTFAGDTLLEMCWPDSVHGYIAAERDSTLLVYRFVPNPDLVSRTEPDARATFVMPNPARAAVTIKSAVGSRVDLLDLLGREALRGMVPASGSLTLDVSQLPRRMYMVMIEEHGTMVPAGRVILN